MSDAQWLKVGKDLFYMLVLTRSEPFDNPNRYRDRREYSRETTDFGANGSRS
jgi:hypothetical protein